MRHTTGACGRTVVLATLSCLAPLGLGGCEGAIDQGAKTQEVERIERPQEETFRLNGVEVLRVDLREPVDRPDAAGEVRTWHQAFMVRLALPQPPAWGPAFDLFLGEERVAEYGGWEEGVYFWVYDPARLEALRGRTISYRFDRGPRTEIGSLDFADSRELKTVREEELRYR